MHARLSTAALTAALLCAATPATAYEQLIVFGDSLSDTGNLYSLSQPYVPGALPFQLPQAPYFNGRFSNGPVAVEWLAQGLGASLTNYAVGGATTGLGNNQVPPIPALQATGLRTQVGSFLSGGVVDASALYLVWAGPNDFLGMVPGTEQQTFASAIGNLTQSVLDLYAGGARNFLLPLLPDLGLTPRSQAAGAAAAAGASALSDAFNAALSQSYAQLALLPGAHLTLFDTASTQRSLIANAAMLGFDSTDSGCFSGFVGVPGTVCATPDTHMFWDDIHPTARVHQLLGQQLLAAVPEPSTHGLMAVGLLLLGGALRRRA